MRIRVIYVGSTRGFNTGVQDEGSTTGVQDGGSGRPSFPKLRIVLYCPQICVPCRKGFAATDHQSDDRAGGLSWEVITRDAIANVVLGFIQGRARKADELGDLSGVVTTETLRDVSRRRSRRICQLVAKLEVPCRSRGLQQLQNLFFDFKRELPRRHVPKRLGHAGWYEHGACQAEPPS